MQASGSALAAGGDFCPVSGGEHGPRFEGLTSSVVNC